MSQNCTYDLQLACHIITKQKQSHDLQMLFKDAPLATLTTVVEKKRQGANYHPISLTLNNMKVLCLLNLILHWVFIYIYLTSRTGLLKLIINTGFYCTGTWNLYNFTIFAFRCLTNWFFVNIGRAHLSKNMCFYKCRVELINYTTLFSQNLPFLVFQCIRILYLYS